MDERSVDLIAVRAGTMDPLGRVYGVSGLDTAMRFMAEAFRRIVAGEETEIEIAIRQHVKESEHGTT